MRKTVLAFIAFLQLQFCIGQTVEETYPKTLFCPDDTILMRYDEDTRLLPYRVSRTDKISPGTDAHPGLYVTLYYGVDSLRLVYHNNLPYAHVFYVNFESPKGKTTLRVHFNDLTSYFSREYMDKNKGNVQFDIPETYELANIIWTISPGGQKATDLNKEGAYYQKVMTYFKPYLNHPIFKALEFPDSVYFEKYYGFRENSFAFNFKDKKPGASDCSLLFNGPYYYAYGDELADSSVFGKLKPLVEDFARKSGFRKFYQSNLGYYEKQLQRQKQLLPVRNMWNWLEEQFPQRKFQSYRVVSSPLIGGSHSTQRYATFNKKELFSENVMFICGTDRYDRDKSLTEKQREGLMTGIVFTEIDHNYVNPVTSKYADQVDSFFAVRDKWVRPSVSSNYYEAPTSVFNEYMTHALFCLYILDNYVKADADLIIEYRESMMVDRRNFIRFREFDKELIRLRKENSKLKVVELYPMILQWCKLQ